MEQGSLFSSNHIRTPNIIHPYVMLPPKHTVAYSLSMFVAMNHNKFTDYNITITHHEYHILLWPPYVIGQTIIFLLCGFYLLLLMVALCFRADHYIFILLLWPPYVIGQAIIFWPCGFFLSSSIFTSSIARSASLSVFNLLRGRF